MCGRPQFFEWDPHAILQAPAAASDSAALSHFQALALTGRATRFGLSGNYREVDELRARWFRWHADYGVSRADEGLNLRGRWRMDASRRVPSLDSIKAQTVAITESYLARRAYLHDASYGRNAAGRTYRAAVDRTRRSPTAPNRHYESEDAFRRAFERSFGIGPTSYRARFSRGPL
jgi:hypothetical protein